MAVLAAPVLIGIGYSTAASIGLLGAGAGGVGTEAFHRTLADPAVWRGALWSLWVAGTSTALATLAALLVGTSFRSLSRTDRLARALTLIPFPIPHLAAAIAGIMLLGQSGLLSRLGAAAGILHSPADMVPLVYDRAGVGLILTLAWKEFPFLALIAFAVLRTQGERSEEVARTLGASPAQVTSRVTLPLLWRGLLPGIVAVLVFTAGVYEPAAVLAPSDPVALPLQIMERATAADLSQRGDAQVLVLLTLAAAIVVAGAHEWVRGRWERDAE